MTKPTPTLTAPSYRTSSAPAYQDVIAKDRRPAPPVVTEYSEIEIPVARVPRSRYTSKAYADLEMERLWPRVWQMACREEQIPEVGDIHVYEGPGASLLIVRAGDDDVRAYYNSCRHRGMKLCSDHTSVAKISCPFHGFAWKLDGTLDYVPSRWDFPELEAAKMTLREVKVGRWGGFVFINRDPDAQPLEKYLGKLIPHFKDWPMEDMYLATIIRREMRANWKVCWEGFVEAFHVPGVHAQALAFGGDSSTQYDVWPDDENVSRFLEATGIPGDQYPKMLTEQEILDASLRIVFPGAQTPALDSDTSARQFMADAMRQQFSQMHSKDYSHLSDAEALDPMQYSLFPNIVLFRSLGYPYAYRFIPVQGNHEATYYDFMMFAPKPA
ncbi:MAG: aromatic ring-hydroxylating dioxygenase subunit alpha, partial [Caulobacterales bacterium]